MVKSYSFIHSFNSQMFYWMPLMYEEHFSTEKNVERDTLVLTSLQMYN